VTLRRIPSATLWLLSSLGAACGGAAAGASGPEDPASEPSPGSGPEDDDLERARSGYGRGDLVGARDALARVLERRPDDPATRRLAARVAAALGNDEGALALLEGTDDPEMQAMRARLLIRAERLVTVARALAPELEARAADPAPGDEILEAYLAIARAGAIDDLYVPVGDRAEVPWAEGVPLPVVDVVLDDGAPSKALVATSADLLVLHAGAVDRLARFRGDDAAEEADAGSSEGPGDGSAADAPPDGGPDPGAGEAEPVAGGVVGRLRIGDAGLDRVPFVTRDLSPIAVQLGTPIVAVIGLDLLLELRATLDGPGRRLLIRPGGWDGGARPAGGVPFATFSGAHLAVRARLTDQVGGYMLVDSAGLFPLAVVPQAIDAMGLSPDELTAIPGSPSPDVRQFALPAVRLGDVVLEAVPAITGLAPDTLGPSIGAPIAGLVGQQVLERFTVTLDGDARRLRIE